MTASWVYRAYDGTGRLIYVGSTRNIFGRLDTHRRQSWWSAQVTRVEAKVYPSMATALAVERALIADGNPRWNIKGRWASRHRWTAEDYTDYHQALVMKGNAHTAHTAQHLFKVRVECHRRFGVSIIPERAA